MLAWGGYTLRTKNLFVPTFSIYYVFYFHLGMFSRCINFLGDFFRVVFFLALYLANTNRRLIRPEDVNYIKGGESHGRVIVAGRKKAGKQQIVSP